MVRFREDNSIRSVLPAGYGYAPVNYGYAETDGSAEEACARRFRTYDPRTGTYIAKGGVRRACP